LYEGYHTKFAGSTQKYRSIKSTNQNENYPKKSMYLKKVEKPKIRMKATRRNLQARPIILKKLSVLQIYQSDKKIPKKSMFSTLKVKRAKNFYRSLPARPKILKKIVGTSNKPIRAKNSQKKVCLVA
jgi:hypothetical protein